MTSRLSAAITLAVLVGCSAGSATDAPHDGGSSGGGAAPPTATVSVGNDVFTSGHNGSANPAVDTIAAGGTVTWTWTNTGNVPHTVESEGSPSFTSSAIRTGDGSTHQVTFTTPGTYHYDCAVHGSAMTGTIVVR